MAEQFEWCIAAQREALSRIAEEGGVMACLNGAWLGVSDCVAEEVLVRLAMRTEEAEATA